MEPNDSLLLTALISDAAPSERDVEALYALTEREYGGVMEGLGKAWAHPPARDMVDLCGAALEEWRRLIRNPEEQDAFLPIALLSLGVRVLQMEPEKRDEYYWDLVAFDSSKLLQHSLEAEAGEPNLDYLRLFLSWPAAHYVLVYDPDAAPPGRVDLSKAALLCKLTGASMREEGSRSLRIAQCLAEGIDEWATSLGTKEVDLDTMLQDRATGIRRLAKGEWQEYADRVFGRRRNGGRP